MNRKLLIFFIVAIVAFMFLLGCQPKNGGISDKELFGEQSQITGNVAGPRSSCQNNLKEIRNCRESNGIIYFEYKKGKNWYPDTRVDACKDSTTIYDYACVSSTQLQRCPVQCASGLQCQEGQCVSPPTPGCTPNSCQSGQCGIGIPDGCGGTLDCGSCQSGYSCQNNQCAQQPQCGDSLDNDGDGKIDMNDPGCSSSSDNDETDPSSGSCRRISIPLYDDPGPSGGLWNDATAGAPATKITIMNPADGPGTSSNQDYVREVQEAQAAGIKVLGYVFTLYGQRDSAVVKAEVDKYKQWYKVDGIFYDEVSSDVGTNDVKINYYKDITAYVRNNPPGTFVMNNPGTVPDERYVKENVADNHVIFESDYNEYTTRTFPSWVNNYAKEKFTHLVYATTSSQFNNGWNIAQGHNVFYVYFTDDVLDNPWNTLPSYWSQEVQKSKESCGDVPSNCGNSVCDAGETASSCPGDCPASCGDSACTHSETCSSCPGDCGQCGGGGSGSGTIDERIATADDDIEEQQNGGMDQGSSDLEMFIVDPDTDPNTPDYVQVAVGVRYKVNIPQKSRISAAYLKFTVDEASSDATQITIKADDRGNSPAFTTSSYDLTNRPKTTASVNWNPVPAWNTVDESGPNQQTPDIKAIVQEVVDRQDWFANNYMSFIITGSGRRVAHAYENSGSSTGTALLHVEYGPACDPACGAGQYCDAGQCKQCSTKDQMCSGKQCGGVTNECGEQFSCGTCPVGQSCTSNQCTYACNDGVDNDNDGLKDYGSGTGNDPGCSSATDNTETGTAICDNGADEGNDRDTLADYRLSNGDPGCTSAPDSSEIDGVCDDNADDASDSDTLADASDAGCGSTTDTREIDGDCDDTIDNDNDGKIDYPADPECSSFGDIETPGPTLKKTPVNFKVAFIGDSGYGADFQNVLTLIKNEGADMVVHPGDLGYGGPTQNNVPGLWEDDVEAILDPYWQNSGKKTEFGSNCNLFPYFISAGNHETGDVLHHWTQDTTVSGTNRGYRQMLRDRLNCHGLTVANGNYDNDNDPNNDGMKSSFAFQNLFVALTAPGEDCGSVCGGTDDQKAAYITRKMKDNSYLWDVSAWHRNRIQMQVGNYDDSTSMDKLYENTRMAGGIIATAHYHSYERTWILDDMINPHVVDNSCSTTNCADPLTIFPESTSRKGQTFQFVSAVGGASNRAQTRCLGSGSSQYKYPYGCSGEWASIFSDEDCLDCSGAFFIEFNVDGDPRKARAYFKSTGGQIWENEPFLVYNDAPGAVS